MIMGFTFLPTCCSKEIKIPMGWTTAGCPAGHWTYRRHAERTGHSYCIIHVDDLKICPAPANAGWTPGPSTAKSLCASTVAFRPGSVVSGSDSTPSVIVSTCDNASHTPTRSAIRCNLDDPIDLTDHILSPFFVRDLYYQGCRFHSIEHLMCFRYAVLHGLRLFATSVRKWTKHLTDFPTSRFQTPDWLMECCTVLTEIYSHLCLSDMAVKTALIDTGPRPFCFNAQRRGGIM